jgi:hypothetical protein
MVALEDDPALVAWQRVRKARRNDVAYLDAILEFERAVPTTERGVILKLKLARQRKKALAEGDVLTWRGCVHQAKYAKTIEEALKQLTAGASNKCQRTEDDPTPARGASRRRPKSVEGIS